jgi:uncharacterized protein (DUF924 family)
VGKHGTVGQATDDNITRRMRIACWIPKATNTHSEIQGDQKVSVHLIITVQKNKQKYFKQFQSLTMIT